LVLFLAMKWESLQLLGLQNNSNPKKLSLRIV
jgi:hypothetical protein